MFKCTFPEYNNRATGSTGQPAVGKSNGLQRNPQPLRSAIRNQQSSRIPDPRRQPTQPKRLDRPVQLYVGSKLPVPIRDGPVPKRIRRIRTPMASSDDPAKEPRAQLPPSNSPLPDPREARSDLPAPNAGPRNVRQGTYDIPDVPGEVTVGQRNDGNSIGDVGVCRSKTFTLPRSVSQYLSPAHLLPVSDHWSPSEQHPSRSEPNTCATAENHLKNCTDCTVVDPRNNDDSDGSNIYCDNEIVDDSAWPESDLDSKSIELDDSILTQQRIPKTLACCSGPVTVDPETSKQKPFSGQCVKNDKFRPTTCG